MTLLSRLAWRNIWRNPRRTWLTVSALAIGVALSMATIALMDGMFAQTFELAVSQNLGHLQLHHPSYPAQRALLDTVDDAAATLAVLEHTPGVRAISGRVHSYALLAVGERSAGGLLLGVEPDREAALSHVDRSLLHGRWLGPAAAAEIVLGAGLADSLQARVGDEVVAVTQAADGSMGNELYRVVGVFRTGSVIRDRGAAFVHLADAQALLALDDSLHEIAVLGAGRAEVPALATAVQHALSGRPLLLRRWDQIQPQLRQMLDLQDAAAGLILLIVYAVAALGVLNTMLMSVFERTRELGVIRALGLGPGQVVALVLLESIALASVAVALGAGLGAALDTWLVIRGFDLRLIVDSGAWTYMGVAFDSVLRAEVRPGGIVATVGGLFAISVLASLWPAVRAARLQPVAAMRQE